MNAETLGWLRSDEGRVLMAGLPPYNPSTALGVAARLRGQGYSADVVAAALSQHRLRSRAIGRLGPEAARLWFTPDGAEQATRPEVAMRRAARIAEFGAAHVADLGCGIGMDSVAFARAGLRVTAYERDAVTAAVARANTEDLRLTGRIEVIEADVRDADLAAVDAAFVDPARRRGGRRLQDPETWSPRFSWVVLLAQRIPATAAKVAPGIAHDLPPEGTETEWVSVDGDLLEACVWFGPLAMPHVRRRATVLPTAEQVSDTGLTAPAVGDVGAYLLEPDDAVIRAGLVGHVVERVGGRLVDSTIAYVTCDRAPATSGLWVTYAVTDVLPFNLKRLRALLRDRQVGAVEVKKRGSAVEPETLRPQLRLDKDAPNTATVVLTRVRGEPTVVLVSRLG
ncbi:MAG: methyltransferase domain-containing protein [Candidatus Nanopelagicales bacterium]